MADVHAHNNFAMCEQLFSPLVRDALVQLNGAFIYWGSIKN